MAFFQWFKVMLSMSTLFAYCYIQNDTATFDMFFCWHLFSLLFYVNKVLWDPGILLHPPLYPFEKDSNLRYCKTFFLFSNLQAVNRWAGLL